MSNAGQIIDARMPNCQAWSRRKGMRANIERRLTVELSGAHAVA
jgi:hypothetical protein